MKKALLVLMGIVSSSAAFANPVVSQACIDRVTADSVAQVRQDSSVEVKKIEVADAGTAWGGGKTQISVFVEYYAGAIKKYSYIVDSNCRDYVTYSQTVRINFNGRYIDLK